VLKIGHFGKRKTTTKVFEVWCWRRMKISWTDSVRNEGGLYRVKVERDILRKIKEGRVTGLFASGGGNGF